jgi:hypothetical protein
VVGLGGKRLGACLHGTRDTLQLPFPCPYKEYLDESDADMTRWMRAPTVDVMNQRDMRAPGKSNI